MRSQKQKNRSPRPFKRPTETRNWSGGKRDVLRDVIAKAMAKKPKPSDPPASDPEPPEKA